MKKRMMVAILLGVLGAIDGLAQTPAFTGAWVLDASRSVLHQAGTREIELEIVDNGSTVNVTERIRAGEDHFSCTTDSKPCEHTTAGGSAYTRVLRREKGALVWKITMTRLADKASITFSERWSLSDEERTLTVHRVYPAGREVLLVFARKRS